MEDREILLQELYVKQAHGPWKVLVVCQTLNQTTWVQAEKALEKIFAKWGDPGSLGLMSLNDVGELEDILRPMGLYKRRVANLLTMSLQYTEEFDRLENEYERYDVTKFAGCGPYARDAWDLFVLRRKCNPTDKRLRYYAEKEMLLKTIKEEVI